MSEFREMQKNTRTRGFPSWYEKITPELDEKRKKDLDDALADRSIFPGTIIRVLKDWGYDVTKNQVAWHRESRGL